MLPVTEQGEIVSSCGQLYRLNKIKGLYWCTRVWGALVWVEG